MDASSRRPWMATATEWISYGLVFIFAASGNVITRVMDAQREEEALLVWKATSWEFSSAIVAIALMPAVLWLCDRWPLHGDTWRRRLPLYLLSSVLWSLLHIVGMVAIRKGAYAAFGEHYDFGDWPTEMLYEYLKDVRTFAVLVFVDHGYRWFRRRQQGEITVLGSPDEGDPVDPVDRPERFLVRKLNREFLIAATDIEWIQAAGNYVNLRVRGHDYPLRSTIGGIESRLDPDCFARVHRSYIVNFVRIASIEPLDTGDARVHLKDGTVLPCSRRYRDLLRSRAAAV